MQAVRAKTARVLTAVGVLFCGTLRADPIEDLSRQATSAYNAGDFARAVVLCRELVQLAPTRPEARWFLGRALLKSGEPAAALSACEAGQRVQAGADQKVIDGLAACIASAQTRRRRRAGCSGERPGMACIAGGWFTMGSNDGDGDEKPPRRLEVKTFYMDKTEVKVKDYRACVNAGRCRAQMTVNYSWAGKDEVFLSRLCNLGMPDRDEHPMNCVEWEQASAYCAYVGKRLPTEMEWEYAARGAAGRRYPWGNQPAPGPTLMNACGDECVDWARGAGLPFSRTYAGNDGWGHTAPVGQYRAGRTPEGLLDMAGNVSEWVQDAYAPCYDSSRCNPDQAVRVLRSAAWNDGDPRDARGADRNKLRADTRASDVGFRCARD